MTLQEAFRDGYSIDWVPDNIKIGDTIRVRRLGANLGGLSISAFVTLQSEADLDAALAVKHG
jgi:hypothetical protein